MELGSLFRVVFKEKKEQTIYSVKEGIEMEEMLKYLAEKEKYYLLKIYESFDNLSYINTVEWRHGKIVRPQLESKPTIQQKPVPNLEETVKALSKAHPSRNDFVGEKLMDFLNGIDITKPKFTVVSNNKDDDKA